MSNAQIELTRPKMTQFLLRASLRTAFFDLCSFFSGIRKDYSMACFLSFMIFPASIPKISFTGADHKNPEWLFYFTLFYRPPKEHNVKFILIEYII
jgi:hypothetical protein